MVKHKKIKYKKCNLLQHTASHGHATQHILQILNKNYNIHRISPYAQSFSCTPTGLSNTVQVEFELTIEI